MASCLLLEAVRQNKAQVKKLQPPMNVELDSDHFKNAQHVVSLQVESVVFRIYFNFCQSQSIIILNLLKNILLPEMLVYLIIYSSIQACDLKMLSKFYWPFTLFYVIKRIKKKFAKFTNHSSRVKNFVLYQGLVYFSFYYIKVALKDL